MGQLDVAVIVLFILKFSNPKMSRTPMIVASLALAVSLPRMLLSLRGSVLEHKERLMSQIAGGPISIS